MQHCSQDCRASARTAFEPKRSSWALRALDGWLPGLDLPKRGCQKSWRALQLAQLTDPSARRHPLAQPLVRSTARPLDHTSARPHVRWGLAFGVSAAQIGDRFDRKRKIARSPLCCCRCRTSSNRHHRPHALSLGPPALGTSSPPASAPPPLSLRSQQLPTVGSSSAFPPPPPPPPHHHHPQSPPPHLIPRLISVQTPIPSLQSVGLHIVRPASFRIESSPTPPFVAEHSQAPALGLLRLRLPLLPSNHLASLHPTHSSFELAGASRIIAPHPLHPLGTTPVPLHPLHVHCNFARFRTLSHAFAHYARIRLDITLAGAAPTFAAKRTRSSTSTSTSTSTSNARLPLQARIPLHPATRTRQPSLRRCTKPTVSRTTAASRAFSSPAAFICATGTHPLALHQASLLGPHCQTSHLSPPSARLISTHSRPLPRSRSVSTASVSLVLAPAPPRPALGELPLRAC